MLYFGSIKNRSMKKIKKAYDYDGVASEGIELQEGAPIITGRSFEELDKVDIKGHPVYFNPKTFAEKNLQNSAEWKAEMINKLGIEEFFENEDEQADIIEKLCPNCNVNRVYVEKICFINHEEIDIVKDCLNYCWHRCVKHKCNLLERLDIKRLDKLRKEFNEIK